MDPGPAEFSGLRAMGGSWAPACPRPGPPQEWPPAACGPWALCWDLGGDVPQAWCSHIHPHWFDYHQSCDCKAIKGILSSHFLESLPAQRE